MLFEAPSADKLIADGVKIIIGSRIPALGAAGERDITFTEGLAALVGVFVFRASDGHGFSSKT